MTDKEQTIVNELLDAISHATTEERGYAIGCYSEFLNTVNIRLMIEAQQIENERNRNL